MFPLFLPIFLLVSIVRADVVEVPASSFNSYGELETYWDYLYPWGSDHNGAARMVGNSTDHSRISVASGTLTLKATPVTGQPPSTAAPYPAINYFSGAIHAKEQININGTDAVGYQVEGEFSSPTAVGVRCWPAFWLTAVNGWPPEADIGEWKGTNNSWFNTFNTSTVVDTTIVSWPGDYSFHSLKAVLRVIPNNTQDLSIEYYKDNVLEATHIAANFYGAPMWLIVNLQMEGSSGTPGPANGATYQARNVQVTRLTT
ncbi:glycoside hydrolase family 16 protein [Serpula lacrymans var. lacrymans S7.3]|uniref:Glycoside hydrolase family 16 protein n=1 Tax=Serpula lacrymans var. lacrymans (strain S7.3) TaxID=936435 RepID=F8Q1H2_SERL3|nr:glycoside hydrolase family 16 protein [Serpula lacrymans var. lacrymans S7.3]